MTLSYSFVILHIVAGDAHLTADCVHLTPISSDSKQPTSLPVTPESVQVFSALYGSVSMNFRGQISQMKS